MFPIASAVMANDIAIRGSGTKNTYITGTETLNLIGCHISDVNVRIPLTFSNGRADHCSIGLDGSTFSFSESELSRCEFTTSTDIAFDSNTKVDNCRIMTSATCLNDGVRISSSLINDVLTLVADTDAKQYIEGCEIKNIVSLMVPTVNLFLSSSEISGSIMMMAGLATIEGNRFSNNESASITAVEGATVHVIENEFDNPLQALLATTAGEIIFKGNVVKGVTTMMFGVNVTATSGICKIEDNTISGAQQTGIELSAMMPVGPGDITVKNNTVTNCGTGVALDSSAPTVLAFVTHNILINNTVTDLMNPGVSVVSHNVIGTYTPAGPYSGAQNTTLEGTLCHDHPTPGQSLGQLP